MTSYAMGPARRVRRGVVALVVAVLALSVASALLTAHSVHVQQRTRFDNQAERLDTALAARMTAYEQVLRGGLGLFLASDDVTRADWVDYVDTLGLDDRYPGFKSLSFAQAVPPEQLEAFEARARAAGEPGADGQPYTVRAPAGSSGTPTTHSPILYVAPDDAVNRKVLGIDMMREPERRAAMEQAARTGEAVASPRLRLSGSDNAEAGFIVYVPIRKDDELLGWVTAAFLARDFAGAWASVWTPGWSWRCATGPAPTPSSSTPPTTTRPWVRPPPWTTWPTPTSPPRTWSTCRAAGGRSATSPRTASCRSTRRCCPGWCWPSGCC